ncbi:HAT, C-terminal dimerization domain [Phytophthora cactorum]|nr:HAT, C-terminal dimerization domain [Phytophthora cactorum]
MPGNENMAAKNGINTDWKKVEENVAMHLFTTMQMELLLEEKWSCQRKRCVTVPFAQDLQQFALQCNDLAFFLPQQEFPSYLRGVTSSTSNMVHVTARRRLTVEEAFVAVLQAEPFLDVDNVLNRLVSSVGTDQITIQVSPIYRLSFFDKEALYTQYMDFKKHALNQKTNKADTLAFRALKERKKSPLQFWFADGSKWPVLQAIACRIFVMPVCAANVASSILRQKTDLLTSDKLTFVRLNSRQLRLVEAEGSSLAALVKKAPTAKQANEITASMVV